jgi:hypothetical protein
MIPRIIEWIWHVRGSLALAPEQSRDEAFDRLAPLFDQSGTTHERTDDTLTFRKKDQAAQDRMAVFDGGVLQIERPATGAVLRYDLTSRALLFCFLAPFLFLGFAQVTIAVAKLEKPSTEAAAKKPAKKIVERQLNPIDKFLGAPAPKKPAKNGKDKDEKDNKPSPTAAYVFAAIFATLYGVGRILEDVLVKSLFRKRLIGA